MHQTAFITGATSGFGEAIARKFAEGGFNLVITGRRQERLILLKQELEAKHNISIHTLAFDVRDKAATETAIASLAGIVSGIDILVNNAGLAAGLSSIEAGDTDDWEQMIDTNVKGLLYVTRQIAPMMKAAGSGHIINIGSTAGKNVYKNGNVYCATKYAVDALTQAMRIDLLPYGIKVTAINPGYAETEFSLVRFGGDEQKAASVYQGFQPLQAGRYCRRRVVLRYPTAACVHQRCYRYVPGAGQQRVCY